MNTINIGILAHIDAGKTSLTERLLFHTGVIDQLGSVDQGNTQTDSLELERERGITIQSAVASFMIHDLKVNLIDTPGHSDFIAEVERALQVLDGAILVISAVEGIQSQTRILMRTLIRMKIPTLIFVNKIDRKGAQIQTCKEISSHCVMMNHPNDMGTSFASVESLPANSPKIAELLAENSETILTSYLQNEHAVSQDDCLQELATQTKQAKVYPVYFGSAVTGAGVEELLQGIYTLIGSNNREEDGPLHAIVFKIERGACGKKIAYVRVFKGAIRLRESIVFYQRMSKKNGKVTAVQVFENGSWNLVKEVTAGNIAKISGIKEIQIGDQIGEKVISDDSFFAPPTLKTVVCPRHPHEATRLYQALQTLAEQDPLINTYRDSHRQEISVCLYGEVQKEVIKEELRRSFNLDVVFQEVQVVCIERPKKKGEALHAINWHGENEYFATVGLSIEPGPDGSGVKYQLGVEQGALPRAYHSVLKENVMTALQQGLHGWKVSDCIVTLTHAEFCPLTFARDFRKLGPIVLKRALALAETEICEPYHSFELEVPEDALPHIISKLVLAKAKLENTLIISGFACLKGIMPAAKIYAFEKELPSLTQGRGIFISLFLGFQPTS